MGMFLILALSVGVLGLSGGFAPRDPRPEDVTEIVALTAEDPAVAATPLTVVLERAELITDDTELSLRGGFPGMLPAGTTALVVTGTMTATSSVSIEYAVAGNMVRPQNMTLVTPTGDDVEPPPEGLAVSYSAAPTIIRTLDGTQASVFEPGVAVPVTLIWAVRSPAAGTDTVDLEVYTHTLRPSSLTGVNGYFDAVLTAVVTVPLIREGS